MTAPLNVACWAYSSGQWRRCKPYGRSGSFKDTELMHTYDSSAWQIAFADLPRALGQTTSINVFSIDFQTPFLVGVGFRFNVDGSCSFRSQPNTPSFVAAAFSWLKYETQFWNYDVYFVDNGSHNLDFAPTLGGSRLPMSSGAYTFDTERTAQGIEEGDFTVSFVDTNAPGPAEVHSTFTLNMQAAAEGDQ